MLLPFHDLHAACFYGGTKINQDHKRLKSGPINILVATPGRLQDHLENTPGFNDRLSKLSFLALDEADQLLDMGFRNAILKILRALPPPAVRQGAAWGQRAPPRRSGLF